MSAKQAIKIANENGYGIGRNGKKGYYVSYFKNSGEHVVRHQLPAEMNLTSVVNLIKSGSLKV